MKFRGHATGNFHHPSRKLSLASRILIGMGLGVLTGLFFGELTSPLQIVSSAYLRLIQMTVIPYVAVAEVSKDADEVWLAVVRAAEKREAESEGEMKILKKDSTARRLEATDGIQSIFRPS